MKGGLTGSYPDAGKDWGKEEKGTAEDEMVGCHHRLNGLEFEQTPGDSEGQGSLACWSPWGWKELDTTWMTEQHLKLSEAFKIVDNLLQLTTLAGFWTPPLLYFLRHHCPFTGLFTIHSMSSWPIEAGVPLMSICGPCLFFIPLASYFIFYFIFLSLTTICILTTLKVIAPTCLPSKLQNYVPTKISPWMTTNI